MLKENAFFGIVNRNCQRRRIMNKIDLEQSYLALEKRLNAISARRKKGV